MENVQVKDTIDEATMRRRVLCETLRTNPDHTLLGQWDYTNLKGCAIGMICGLFKFSEEFDNINMIGKIIGLDPVDSNKIFWDAHIRYGCEMKEVTSEMVADYIEELADAI